MTRKDYIANSKVVAQAMKDAHNEKDSMAEGAWLEATSFIKQIARGLADVAEKDNPNFDREKFLKACGV